MVVKECGEPLVDIAAVCPGLVINIESSRRRTETSLYLRKAVAGMLRKAQQSLPAGFTFVINDAWRPRSAQKRYYEYYVNKFRREHPSWEESRILAEAARLAIPPDDEIRAGHLTGAAVDVELWKNGRRVPLKSTKIPFAQMVLSQQTDLPSYILRNRDIINRAMTSAGFTNYPQEYWHWSYGDAMWAELTGRDVAHYGITEPPVNLHSTTPSSH